MALKLRVSSSENSHRSNHCIRSVWEPPSAETITCVVPNVLRYFVEPWKYVFCRSKSNSSIFQDAASESIVFVVPEGSPALKILFSSSGLGVSRQNHYIRSVWEITSMGGPSKAHRKPIGGSPISIEKTSTFCVSLTPEGLVFDDPMEPLRHARIGFC